VLFCVCRFDELRFELLEGAFVGLVDGYDFRALSGFLCALGACDLHPDCGCDGVTFVLRELQGRHSTFLARGIARCFR